MSQTTVKHSATTPVSHLAPVFAQYPIEVVNAEGVWLHTRDRRRVLDMYGGHAVAAVGYGHPRWIEALEKQARSVLFQTNAVPMEVRERAAARLVRFAGVGMNTAFLVNTGAEANESAVKLARTFPSLSTSSARVPPVPTSIPSQYMSSKFT